MLVFTGLLLSIMALLLIWVSSQRRKQLGLPKGRLVSADREQWQRCEREFFSRRHRLVGRPDFVFQERGRLIPVEVKSGYAPTHPYKSHVLQLAAYCLLIEETTGTPPPYGVIAYPGKHFRVDYTSSLREELLEVMEEMRQYITSNTIPEGAFDRRCRKCGYRRLCRVM